MIHCSQVNREHCSLLQALDIITVKGILLKAGFIRTEYANIPVEITGAEVFNKPAYWVLRKHKNTNVIVFGVLVS